MQSRLHSAGISSYNTGGTARYSPLGTSTNDTTNTTEANAQVPFRTAGTLSNLYVRALAPGSGASATIQLRKNGANANQAISIATNTSGEFEDSTNTDTVVAGDKFCYSITTVTSNYWVTQLSTLFSASSGMMTKFTKNVESGRTFSSANSWYPGLAGWFGTQTTEANNALPSSIVGTWKNLSAYVSANSWNATTTISSRKNTAAGNLSISIGASTTGLFEDTTHSDSIAVGDKMNYQLTTASGSGSITVFFISSEFITTDNTYQQTAGDDSGHNYGSNTTYYSPIDGNLDEFSTWGQISSKDIAPTVFNLHALVSGNTLDAGTSTIMFRANGATSSLVVSIGFGTTGLFSDTTDSVIVGLNQTLDTRIVNAGTTGNLSVTGINTQAKQYPHTTFTADGVMKIVQQVRPKIKSWDTHYFPEAGSKSLNWSLPGTRSAMIREMYNGYYHMKNTDPTLEGTGDFSGARTAGIFTETLVDGHMYAQERVQIVTAPTMASTSWGHVLELTTTHSDVELVYCSDGISLKYKDSVTGLAAHTDYAMNTTSAFHIYKLDITYTTATVSVDGVQVISVSIKDEGAGHYTHDMFIDENWTINAATEHYIDYIKLFPNNGAQEIDFNGIDILYGFSIDDPAYPFSYSLYGGTPTREIVNGEYHWKTALATDDAADDLFSSIFKDYANYYQWTMETTVRFISGATHAAGNKTLSYEMWKKHTYARLLFFTDGVVFEYNDTGNVTQDYFVSMTTSVNHTYKIVLTDTDASFYIDGVLQTTVNVSTSSNYTPELYIDNNYDAAVMDEFYRSELLWSFAPGFTVDGIIFQPNYLTVDGIVPTYYSDQTQLSTGASFGFGEGSVNGQTKYRGQKFTPTNSHELYAIGFDRAKGSKGIKVYIDTVTSGVPTHNEAGALYSFTIPNSSIVDGFGVYFLPIPLMLTGGTEYCFYLAPWDTVNNVYADDYQDVHGINVAGSHEITYTVGSGWSQENLQFHYATLMLQQSTTTFTADGIVIVEVDMLKDNFDEGLDSTKWNVGLSTGTISFTHGLIEFAGSTLTGYNTLSSVSNYALENSHILALLVDAGDQTIVSNEAVLYMALDDNNKLYWTISNGSITARKIVSGVNSALNSTTYNPAIHKWFKIRESGGTVYWDYSTDGVTWTNFASLADPFVLELMQVGLQQGTWQNEARTTVVKWDQFNVTTTLKTFITDGIVLVQANPKTFTIDGDVKVLGNTSPLTLDGVIVGWSDTYQMRFGFFLDNALLKNPKSMTSEFVYTKTDMTMFTGRSVRDIGGLKKQWVLNFENLTQDQVNQIMTIINKQKAVILTINSKDQLVINSTVFPTVNDITYETLGNEYRASMELDLMEQGS